MNKLYSLLLDGIQVPASSFYYKKREKAEHNQKSRNLLKLLVADVDRARMPAFACHVCSLVLPTCFGDEITALDPDNTYFGPVNDPGVALEEAPQLSDLSGPAVLGRVRPLLDADIKERLELPLWHDVMAAGCLQLLRLAGNA